MNLNDASDQVIDALATVGISATIDPAQIEVPGAWASVREVDEFTAGGGGTVLVDVYLIAPDVMPRDAMDMLSSLGMQALTVLDVERMTTNDSIQLPDGGRPKPAFKITTKVEV